MRLLAPFSRGTRLDQRNRRLIDPTCSLNVDLPPSLAHASGANQPADSAIIHPQMIETSAYRLVTDA